MILLLKRNPKYLIESVRKALADEEQSEASGSKRRLARAGVSSVSMAAAKVVQTGLGIISVPILLSYLGREGYGLLLAVTSVLNWFSMTDMGIGLGVKNALIEAFGQHDRRKAQGYVSTGFIGLSIISATLLTVFIIAWPFVPWERIFKLTSTRYAADLNALVFVTAVLVLLNMPVSIVRTIYSADQKEYVNSLWWIVGGGLGFIALLLAVTLDGGIVWLTAGRRGMSVIAVMLCGVFLFTHGKPWLRPTLKSVSTTHWRRIWSSSLSFFIMKISMIVIFQSDIFLVNYFINANEVPLYSMPASLFLYVNMMISFIVGPFWPSFGEAAQKNQWNWIRKAFRNLLVISLGISTFMTVFFFLFGSLIIQYWSRGMVQTSRHMILILGVYSIVQNWTSVHSIFLNGLDKMHVQAISAVIQAVLNILLSVFLIKKMGIIGVALGSLLSFSFTAAWVLPVQSYKIFKAHRNSQRGISETF